MGVFDVTVSVAVSAESLEAAKDAALDYFAQMDEIKDEEIKEVE